MPRFLTLLDGMMEASPTGMLLTQNLLQLMGRTKEDGLRLSSFNFRKFVSIQCCMSAMQGMIRSTISSKVTLDGLNEKYTWVSSV